MKVWHLQINDARDWQQLLRVARDYMAALSPREWDSLPERCRPARLKDIDDLAFWQHRLADEYVAVAASAEGYESLRDALAFFTAATQRATEIGPRALSPGEDAAADKSRQDIPLDRKPRE